MIDYSRLLPVLLVVVALIGGAFVVLLRWLRRFQLQRKLHSVDHEIQTLVGALRATTPGQRRREQLTFALGVSTATCVSWGFFEPDWPTVTQSRIVSPKLRAGATMRVVHLSDFHSEGQTHIEPLVVSKVEHLKPDLILFTGDAINEANGLPVFHTAMKALAKIAPTYSVRGNWETWWFADLDLIDNTGVRALDGRTESVEIRGQKLWLVGVGVDHENALEPALAQVPKGSFTVLLHHFPALAPTAAALGVDVMLAGDTHGGQARLPLLGEVVRVVRRGTWRPSGLQHEGPLWLYVNRGLGNEGRIPRFRFACRPEIGVLEFVGR